MTAPVILIIMVALFFLGFLAFACWGIWATLKRGWRDPITRRLVQEFPSEPQGVGRAATNLVGSTIFWWGLLIIGSAVVFAIVIIVCIAGL